MRVRVYGVFTTPRYMHGFWFVGASSTFTPAWVQYNGTTADEYGDQPFAYEPTAEDEAQGLGPELRWTGPLHPGWSMSKTPVEHGFPAPIETPEPVYDENVGLGGGYVGYVEAGYSGVDRLFDGFTAMSNYSISEYTDAESGLRVIDYEVNDRYADEIRAADGVNMILLQQQSGYGVNASTVGFIEIVFPDGVLTLDASNAISVPNVAYGQQDYSRRWGINSGWWRGYEAYHLPMADAPDPELFWTNRVLCKEWF